MSNMKWAMLNGHMLTPFISTGALNFSSNKACQDLNNRPHREALTRQLGNNINEKTQMYYGGAQACYLGDSPNNLQLCGFPECDICVALKDGLTLKDSSKLTFVSLSTMTTSHKWRGRFWQGNLHKS